jgi:hypothetical protein
LGEPCIFVLQRERMVTMKGILHTFLAGFFKILFHVCFKTCITGRATSIYSICTTQSISQNVLILNIQETTMRNLVFVCSSVIFEEYNCEHMSHCQSLWIPELAFFFKPS